MVRFYTLILKNLFHYWRLNLSVILGTSIATAIILGALIIGDSVQYTLQYLSLTRLGKTQFAISSHRYFPLTLSSKIQKKLKVKITPILLLEGVSRHGNRKLNHTQIIGIQEDFGKQAKRKCFQ